MSDLTFISLTIENFKNFSGEHSFKLERQPGLYYVTGQNLVAPELGANGVGKSTLWDALFWCLFGKTIRDNRPANAVQPWNGKKPTEVQLTWAKGGIDYSLLRSRAPNKLNIMLDGMQSKEIEQEEVPKLIGMSEEMFRRTLILGQFGALFLDLKPEAQSQMFTEALSLDVWMKAVERASAAEKKAAASFIQADRELVANLAIVGNLTEQIGDIEAQAKTFEIDRQARITKIEKGIVALEEDLEALTDNPVAKPQFPTDAKIESLRSDLADEKETLAILKADLAASSRELAQLSAKIQAFEVQAKKAKKTCPECGQVISDKEFKSKLATLTQQAEASAEVSKGQEAEVKANAARVDALLADLTKAQKAFASKEQKYQQDLQAWTAWTAKVAATQNELRRQREQLAGEKKTINLFLQSAEVNKKRRQDLLQKGADWKAQKEDARIAQEQAAFWIAAFREIRLGVIDQALIELEMAASRHASMLGLNDWGIKFETERETKAGAVSYGFTVLLYPPGEDDPVKWESYSGGESQRWQLAVSFGLSEVLLARAGLSPNLEVLDEPTRGLSADGVADLLDHLRDRALELGRAIYFVDHHSLEKGSFDGTLMITKSKQGSSAKWL